MMMIIIIIIITAATATTTTPFYVTALFNLLLFSFLHFKFSLSNTWKKLVQERRLKKVEEKKNRAEAKARGEAAEKESDEDSSSDGSNNDISDKDISVKKPGQVCNENIENIENAMQSESIP